MRPSILSLSMAATLLFFQLASAVPSYTVNLLNDGGGAYANDMDNRGRIVGRSSRPPGFFETATLWQADGTPIDLGSLTGTWSWALAISDSGHVAGYGESASGWPRGILFQGGIAQELPDLGGGYSEAFGVNNLGVAVGYAEVENLGVKAARWAGGLPQLLGAPDTCPSSAYDINDSGLIVGVYRPDGGTNLFRGFVWNGGFQDIGSLGGDYCEARAVNRWGVVVGAADSIAGLIQPDLAMGQRTDDVTFGTRPYTGYRAMRWTAGVMEDLGALEGDFSVANDVNDLGAVVGWSETVNGPAAVLWENGAIRNLNDLIDDPDFVVTEAVSINNKGQIAAMGSHPVHGSCVLRLDPLRPPVLVLPGIAGTYAANVHDMGAWAFTRGIEPAGMQIDPLGHFYDDILQTLENAGYVRGDNLFAATYDWRVVPAPSDNSFDGTISGLSAASITDNVYECGVDYLGFWLKQAMSAWEVLHPGDTLREVDIIAHSTGGLVARSYLQSPAYRGLLPDGRRLPAVRNLVMVGVPNRGATKPWNPLHDDWNVDLTFQAVLSKLINLAYHKVLAGAVVSGPDGDIAAAELLAAPEGPERRFIRRYAPTIASLLATYDFLDTGGGPQNVNSNVDLRNSLILDLNAGLDLQLNGDPNAFADSCRATVIYGTSEATPTVTVQHLGEDMGEGALLPFTDFVPNDAAADDLWYLDLLPAASGDATVPLVSSVGQFIGDARVTRIPFTLGANTQEDVSHCGLMFNPQVQDTILAILDVPEDFRVISTNRHALWGTQAATAVNVAANVVGGTILTALLDPVEGFVVDGQGRRLGWSAATGALSEIPGSTWFGNGDGLGWHFGPLEEPVTLQLTGQGADHYAQVSLATGWGQSGLVSSGALGNGETRNLALPFPPLDVPQVEIAWTGPGQVLLSWVAVPGATSYAIHGAPTMAGPWTLLQSTAGTSTSVTVPDDATRLFRVTATR